MENNNLKIKKIWWRNVQPGEFYNIERHHILNGGGGGGGGSLYIEIPTSLVSKTLEFLDRSDEDVESVDKITIWASAIGKPNLSGPIVFQSKKGRRLRIALQNRQSPSSQRHPAWTVDMGFPIAPDDVQSTAEARKFFPEGGVRIYIAKTVDGKYYAGFTKGKRPADMLLNHPMWDLYPDSIQHPVGGVIDGGI